MKRLEDLEKKLDKNINSIKITFYSDKKGIKHLFERKFKFTLYLSNIRQLVISDNYEKLQNDIIELGMCE